MRFGHKNAAVGSHEDVVRLGEVRGRVAGRAGRAQGHQHFALRAELDHRVAFARSVRKFLQLCVVRGAGIGHPHVALAIHVHPVRPQDQPGPEALNGFPAWIQLDDRVHVRASAGVGAAAITGPDVLAVRVHVNRADRAPPASVRERAPVAHRLVGIRQVVDRRYLGVLGWPRRASLCPQSSGGKNRKGSAGKDSGLGHRAPPNRDGMLHSRSLSRRNQAGIGAWSDHRRSASMVRSLAAFSCARCPLRMPIML